MPARFFYGKKANFGGYLLLGVILFNILSYVLIFYANQDPLLNSAIGKTSNDRLIDVDSSTDADVNISEMRSWTDGFKVNVFGLPGWFNLFYVVFQGILFSVALYSMIRGLN